MSKRAFNRNTYDHCNSHIVFLLGNSPLYRFLLTDIILVTASPGRVVVQLPLGNVHFNSKGGLHGSVSATLVDFIGGVSIASYDERSNTGVSTDMHISYVDSARAGDTIEIEGIAVKVGGTLAYTTATIRKVEEGKEEGEGAVIAIGSHTKFVKQR